MQKSIRTVVSAFTKKARAYRKDQRGNIAMMLGLSIIPMILAAGSAIDFSRIANSKANLVAGLDASALYAAAITGKSEADLKVLARNYFDANYNSTSDAPVTDFDLKNFADKVVVTGTVDVKTWFMSVGGITHVSAPASSEVKKTGSSIEVSLVLDQTGSMSGSKLTNLKVAAKDFIDTVVWDEQTPYFSKAGLVPFTFAVNPGSYASAARGSITAGTSTTPGSDNFKFKDPGGTNRTFPITNCVSERVGSSAATDAATSASKVGRVYDNSTTACNNIPAIVPLTSDRTLLKNTIDNMVAGGSTAGQIGMEWGWFMVSPTVGLWSGIEQPKAYGTDKLKKIVVFMTDGDFNTAYCNGVLSDDWNGGASTGDQINCNATNGNPTTQAQSICTAIKAQNITLYTIGFELPNNTAKTFMKNCATDASKAFDAANSDELKAAFAQIAQNLLSLRVSK
jgi:Flp pilus assembly protein TadG